MVSSNAKSSSNSNSQSTSNVEADAPSEKDAETQKNSAMILCKTMRNVVWVLMWKPLRLLFMPHEKATIILDDVRWPSLFDLKVGRIFVVQQRHPLLQVSNLNLTIDLEATYTAISTAWRLRSLDIANISASHITLFKAPDALETPELDQQEPIVLPSLRWADLPAVRVQKMQVDKFELRGYSWPKEQAPSAMSIQAHAALNGQTPLAATIQVRELNESKGLLNIQLSAENEADTRIKVKADLQQTAGQWLTHWLSLPPEQALQLSLLMATTIPNDQTIGFDIHHIQTELYSQPIIAEGLLDVDVVEKKITIPHFLVNAANGRHKLTGSFSEDLALLDLTLTDLDLGLFKPWVPGLRSGKLDGNGSLHWQFAVQDYPTAQLKIDSTAHYHQENIHLAADLELIEGLLKVARAKVKIADMAVSAKGRVDLSGKKSSFTLTAEHIRDATVRKLLPDTLKDKIPEELTFHAQKIGLLARGSIADPKIMADVNIVGRYGAVPFTAFGNGNLNTQKIMLNHFEAELDRAWVSVEVLADLEGEGSQLQGQLKRVSPDLLQRFGIAVPPSIVGGLSADWTLSGNIIEPVVGLQASFQGGYESEFQVLPFKVEFSGAGHYQGVEHSSLNIEQFKLSTFTRSLMSVKGRLNATDSDFRVHIHRLPSLFMKELGIGLGDGVARARIRFTGSVQEPKVSGYINYGEKLALRDSQDRAITKPLIWHANVSSENKKLLVDSSFTIDTASAGVIDLELPWHDYLAYSQKQQGGAIPLSGRINTGLDISVLQLFIDTDQTTFQGQLSSDLTIKGTAASPVLHGKVSLVDGAIKRAVTGTEFVDVDISASAEAQRFTLESATARDDHGGEIAMQGHIDWQDIFSENFVDVSLSAKNAYLINMDKVNGALSGGLRFAGGYDTLKLDGKLSIQPLNVSIDTSPAPSIPSIDVVELESEHEEPKDDALPDIDLNIDVEVERQAFVRGRGLFAELTGDVEVRGSVKNPAISGAFETLRGEVKLLQKPLKLNEGRANFSNQAFNFYIPATYKADEADITAIVSGTDSEIELELSSVPSLPEEEILSLLLFGSSVQNISALEAMSLASAVNTLSSGSTFDPLNQTRDRLGFDSLRIGQDTEENGGGVNVGVGKYLNERVYLELERSSNPAQPWNGNVKIDLTNELRIDSSTNSNGQSSALLEWRKDY